MHFSTLQQFRRNLYDCFEAARDALFNVNDALLTDCLAQSLIELSLASCFERKFSSVYAAFRDGRLERKRLRELFASYASTPTPGHRLILAVDATNINPKLPVIALISSFTTCQSAAVRSRSVGNSRP
jgi:hypothetical protein